jgi:methylase of polypeptide subunit release factors
LFVLSERFDLFIQLKPGGYTPKSAFLLISSLYDFDFSCKKVLDFGCGETGILAHFAHVQGAEEVTGIDIDPAAIEHVKTCSNVSHEIQWITSDFQGLSLNKFDLIITNPPQMPMPTTKRDLLLDWHDSPGEEGTEVIFNILEQSSCDCDIFMIIFDFLKKAVEEKAKHLGFNMSVKTKTRKAVRPGGQTEKNLGWIKKMYPNYQFIEKADKLYFDILVIKFSK